MANQEDYKSDEQFEIRQKEKYLDAINTFAQILFEAQTLNEIVWTVTQNAIAELGYYDCVIYLYDEEKNRLVQKAAHGPKNPVEHEIVAPLELIPGEGIAGAVFISGVGEIIADTTKDERYIVDDEVRYSEIAIPMFHKGNTIGVIDCEHHEKNFFTEQDFKLLTTLAALTSTKIAQAQATRELLDYKENLEEIISEKTKQLEKANAILFEQNSEKELLIKEIHHRVKNNMQIMISLVNLQVASAESRGEQTSLIEFGDRIRSMAIIHERLYQEKDLSTIAIDQYITELVQSILSSYEGRKEVSIDYAINPLRLDLDTSIPLGLIINELVTNSLKHAFDEVAQPKITLHLSKSGKVSTFEYRDNGPGFTQNKGEKSSFGLDLIEILANQIGKEFKINSEDGGHCSFQFKKEQL